MARINGSKSSAKHIAVREVDRKILAYRTAGLSMAAIAPLVGMKSGSSVYKSLIRALDRLEREPAEALRRLEADRLDAMHQALWPLVVASPPDIPAVLALIKIMERRAWLLGLDAPKEIDVRGHVEVFEAAAAKIYGDPIDVTPKLAGVSSDV
jgi:hypothetical protein